MFPGSHLFISCSYPFISTNNPGWRSSSCLIMRRDDDSIIVNDFARDTLEVVVRMVPRLPDRSGCLCS